MLNKIICLSVCLSVCCRRS